MEPTRRISTPVPAPSASSNAQTAGHALSLTMPAPTSRPSRPSTPLPASGAFDGQPILPLTPSALFASSAPLGQPTANRSSASSSRQSSFYDGHYRGGTANSSYKASSSRLSSWVSAPWIEDFPRIGASLSTQLTEPTLPLPRAPSRAGHRQTARAPTSELHRSHSSSALPQQVFWTAVPPVLPSSASSASASSARYVQDRERAHYEQGRTRPGRGSASESSGERTSFLTRMFDRSRQDADSMAQPSSPSLDASSPPERADAMSSPDDGANSRSRETDQLLPSRKRGKEPRAYIVKSAASPRSYGSLDPYMGDRFSPFTSSSSSSSSPMDPMHPWTNGRPVPLTTGRLLALALLLAALASAIILAVLVVYSSTHTVSDLRANVRAVSLLERASDNSTMGMELVLQLTAQNPNRLGAIDLTPSAPLSVALVRVPKAVAILDPVFPDAAAEPPPPPPPSEHGIRARRPLRNTPCHHAPYVHPSNLGDLGALYLHHATEASRILHVPSGGNVAVHVRGRTRPEATTGAPLWAAYVNQTHHGTRWYLWIHGSYTAHGVLAVPRTVPVCEAIVLPKAVDLPRHLLDGQLLVV
ncbi:hypothetical protein AMAG_00419 [Allomyces macrogynus ATCC 38327]|uniref:Uncharacterized protein n=1 Tax=Allomyces macrogynus (strain ATCC 38327) TaxID=578462 RepID=A0A0L0RWG1_ALLM3|nr:hypothetical protein AMAG_00419 [Allomyces macrogynus ATCC 38327]|eukprot:KNE54445.1 hypothetical protein AMAG_00419 [Allomyces macrogynus ATCC 38327]